VAVPELYVDGPVSRYYYRGGWNPTALAAFAPSAVVCLVLALVPGFAPAAPYSWFVGVVLAGGLYLLLARRDRAAFR
jgi:nucleobase:cation symporter-1, NCS1 family